MFDDLTTIAAKRRGAVLCLTLNRPDVLNAMNDTMFTEIGTAFRRIAEDISIRAVVLAGAGKHFTAGLDLKEAGGSIMDGGTDPGRRREQFYRHVRRWQDCFTAIEDCGVPVIAAVHGACIGGGVDLVCACDLRVASATSYFTVQEIEVGIVADIGTLQRLPRLIPEGVVRELAYTARKFPTEEAARYGFVNRVAASDAEVFDTAFALAEEIAAKSPLAITGIKRVLNHAREHSIADGLDYVATWNSGMLMSEDLSKAMTAVLTKSPAEFADRFERQK